VADASGFVVGGAVNLRSEQMTWRYDIMWATVTAIRARCSASTGRQATTSPWARSRVPPTAHPILTAEEFTDVRAGREPGAGRQPRRQRTRGRQLLRRASFSRAAIAGSSAMSRRELQRRRLQFSRSATTSSSTTARLGQCGPRVHPGSGSSGGVPELPVRAATLWRIYFCWDINDGLVENCVLVEKRSASLRAP